MNDVRSSDTPHPHGTRISPTRVARLAENDRDDIRSLVRLGLTTSDEIEQRATSALGGYVGGETLLRLNLRDAVAIAREAETDRAGGNGRE